MPRGKKHSPEVRAAVTAALLTGQGVNEVASQYKLDKSVVSRWRAPINSDELQQVADEKREEFAELLAVSLRETIRTLTIQVQFFRSEKWLKDQSAAELATLFGVITDTVVRILEAAGYSQQRE